MSNIKITTGLEAIQNALEEAKGSFDGGAWARFANTYANVKISDYTVKILYDIRNEVTKQDNSIEFDFYGVKSVEVTSNVFNQSDGKVHYRMWVDNNNNGVFNLFYDNNTTMGSSINFLKDFTGSTPKHYTIMPQTYLNIPKTRLLHWLAESDRANDEFYYTIGDGNGFYNPLPATYKPTSVKINGVWKSANQPNGFIKVKKNNAWVDVSTEQTATILKPETGQNRIKTNGQWLQQPPM